MSLAFALAATPARAQGSPAARVGAWIEDGIRLRGERRDAEALAQFRRAWEASQGAEARAQMALAEHALGQWVEAERDLVAALGSAADPWIARHRAHLDAALAVIRQHLGSLEVRSATPGARASVNGGELVALPLAAPLRVVIGTVRVEVRAEGCEPARRELDVRAGDDLVETFALVEAAPPPRTPPAPATVPPPVVMPVPAAVPVVVPAADAPTHPLRAWGVRLLVGAGGMLVVGAGALVWRELAAVEFNAEREPRCELDGAAPGGVAGGSLCASLQGQAEAARALAITGIAVGGALALGGAVMLLAAPRDARRAGVTCAPGPLAVTCGVRF